MPHVNSSKNESMRAELDECTKKRSTGKNNSSFETLFDQQNRIGGKLLKSF